MSHKHDHNSMSDKADGAIKQAANDVIQRAKQTGTPVIVWKDGQIQEVPPEQFEQADERATEKRVKSDS